VNREASRNPILMADEPALKVYLEALLWGGGLLYVLGIHLGMVALVPWAQ
jgi:hypothetical protein